MLRVTNYGAACCVIEGQGVRILCDPWLDGDIYLGAWEREHYLPDPLTTIGPADAVWVSHLHEDHYHPDSLRSYLTAYPKAVLWIGDHDRHMPKLMERHGFKPCVQSYGWGARSVPNNGYPNAIDNIDSALVVVEDDRAVVNMNDCPYDQGQVDKINQLTAGLHVTALLPYAGAGPWPQCFTMSDSARLAAANDKRQKFLDQFQRYRDALHADIAVPFSAGYRLRGELNELNPYLGIPKPEEVPGATVLPVIGAAKRPESSSAGYVWEDMPLPSNDEIERLLQQAQARSPKVSGEPLTIDLNWGASAAYVDATYAPADAAHETINVDPRLLHGLLTRKFHWNSAEIGSVLKINRHGGTYDPRVFDYLYMFHI